MKLSELTEPQIQNELAGFEAMNQIIRRHSIVRIEAAIRWIDENADPTKASTRAARRVCEAALRSKQDHKVLLDYYRTYLILKPYDPRIPHR